MIVSSLFTLLCSLRDSRRRGFTLIEVLIFSAILAIVAVAFSSILISVTRVQVRQQAAAEVNQQSQFLLQTFQRYIETSSLIELAADTATTTLKLRMTSSTADPTYLYLSGGIVYLKETDSGTPQPLTSSNVSVTNLTFKKRANPPGRDSVSIVFTVTYSTASPQKSFSQSIDTAVARVSAATFDSNVVPSTPNFYKVGVSSQAWQSINDIIYFSGSNVGIGVSSPGQTVEVNGGLRLNTTASQPSCSSAQRGTFWVVQSGAGAKDNVQVCVKNASGTYAWAPIY